MPIDNSDLGGKLELRRWFLDRYHSEPLRVIDACAGERAIWSVLEREYAVESYVGLDKKRTEATVLKVDSVRWLRDAAWDCDVLDIDTYGEPWGQYHAALERFPDHPVTVFLTMGSGRTQGNEYSRVALDRVGIPQAWRERLPRGGTGTGLREHLFQACLAPGDGVRVVEARFLSVKTPGANTEHRYIGLRLEKKR